MYERWNEWFYQGSLWEEVRSLYVVHAHGLCERCGAPGVIVHHREHLTPENIHDKAKAYGFDNLELLCLRCHNDEHFAVPSTMDGLFFDDNGDLVQMIPPGEAER